MEIPLDQLSEVVAFCDPSGGKAIVKRARSRAAISVLAQDHMTRIFSLYAWADYVSTDKLYEKIFWVNDQWKPRLFGIEANGLQSLFGDGIRREARMDGHHINVYPVTQPTKLDKFFRNRSALQSIIARGRFFIQDHQVELISELEVHPMSMQCDMVDAAASATQLLRRRTSPQIRSAEADGLAKYLRSKGAPAWYIIKRVAEIHAKERGGKPLPSEQLDKYPYT
jgi:hypothetical protein